MYIEKFSLLAATCFLLSVETAPQSLSFQLRTALQQVAELKGDAFDSCCNVSPIIILTS